MKEGDILREITDALTAAGVLVIRVQSGKVQVRRGWMHLAPEGTPDLACVIPPWGHALLLEVKTAKGRERAAQRRMAKQLTSIGATVRTVRSVDEALAALAEARAMLRKVKST